MATLVARPGDPQALKAAAAAAAAGASLAVMPLADASWKRLLTAGAPLAADPQLLLVLPNGSALTEPNAMARFLAGGLGGAASLGEESWLEWEAHALRPAALSGDAAALAAAAERLAAAGASATHFLSAGGAAPGLADWAVCATLAGLAPDAPVRPGSRVTGWWLNALHAAPQRPGLCRKGRRPPRTAPSLTLCRPLLAGCRRWQGCSPTWMQWPSPRPWPPPGRACFRASRLPPSPQVRRGRGAAPFLVGG